MSVTSRALERICVGDVCHCDVRLSVYNCEEQDVALIMNYLNIGLSIVGFVLGFAIIGYRYFVKGQKPLEFGSADGKGWLRPKPVESLLLFSSIFHVLRTVSSIILVTDAASDNMTFRSFIFEFPWQFGFASFVVYVLGVAQAMTNNNKLVVGWLPPPRIVDAIGLTSIFAPVILNNTVAIAAGAVATTNEGAAEVLTRILYVLWFIHGVSFCTYCLYAGTRLVRILQGNLSKFQPGGARYVANKTAIFKIKLVVALIFICMLSFALFLFLYGILRDLIMVSTAGNLTLFMIWNLLGCVTFITIALGTLITPKVKDDDNKMDGKDSSLEKSNNPFGATLSLNAFDFKKTTGHVNDLNPIDEGFANYKGVPIPEHEHETHANGHYYGNAL